MLQPRLQSSIRVVDRIWSSNLPRITSKPVKLPTLSSGRSTYSYSTFYLSSIPTHSRHQFPNPTSALNLLAKTTLRYASHATQGRANAKAKNTAGRRLGAKKTGEQYVVPGNIIFRQRGTKWFPGENCGMGRDHTIYATEAGYVKYYLDPEKHPKRKYIGVCFERDGRLPTPRNAPTRRRLNRYAVKIQQPDGFGEDIIAVVTGKPRDADVNVAQKEGSSVAVGSQEAGTTLPLLRPGYMYREANWQIGRAAENAGIKEVKFNRNDRFLAWRKRTARAERAAQMKSLKNKKGSKKRKAKVNAKK